MQTITYACNAILSEQPTANTHNCNLKHMASNSDISQNISDITQINHRAFQILL